MNLGAPIGSNPNPNAAPRNTFDQGEHGAGIGLSGGHGTVTSENTQAGKYAQEDSFNAGLGGQHASGGIPSGTPIADKFSNSSNTPDPYGQQSGGRGLGGDKLDNSLDQYSGERGYGGQGQGSDAVSGAYAGSGTSDGLTGQSGAHTTGAGVGIGGENLRGEEGHHHHHHHHHGSRDAALAGTAGGAAAGAGIVGSKEYDEAYGHSGASAASAAPLARAEGVAGLGGGMVPGVGGIQGSGIGPNDSEGERYSTERRDPGYGNESGSGGPNYGSGAVGAGLGAGAGAGAYETYENQGQGQRGSSGAGGAIAEGGLSGTGGQGVNEPGTGGGKYGRAQQDSSTGQPLSDPKDLDTGNPHSLIYDEASGKYVHRRDLEGNSGSTHGAGRTGGNVGATGHSGTGNVNTTRY